MNVRTIGPGVGKHVLITFDDRSVGIMTPAPVELAWFNTGGTRYRIVPFPSPGWVEAEIAKAAASWLGGLGKVTVRHRVIEAAEIPGDRFYRDAWVEDAGAIVHDMPRARAIHRLKLRAVADVLLRPLTLDYIRADAAGRFGAVQKRRVGEQIERLAALSEDPAIDAATTIEQLRALWPFGEQASVGTMARRALARGPLLALAG